MTVPVGRWHLGYTGEAIPVGHICDLHRAIGLSLPCEAPDQDGECGHVQIALCKCAEYVPCDACMEAFIAN